MIAIVQKRGGERKKLVLTHQSVEWKVMYTP